MRTDAALSNLGIKIEGWDPNTADRAAIVRADAAVIENASKPRTRADARYDAPKGWDEPAAKNNTTPISL